MIKLNNSENYEHLCNVRLTKDKFPIAFEHKVQELIEDCGMSREEAEADIPQMEIELELYYHPSYGLFAVESEAVERTASIFSPYTGEELEDADE